MKAADLEQFSRTLLSDGIANTFEYPGYISIQYRGHTVTIGIDRDLMSIQITKDTGESIVTPKQFTFRVDTVAAFNDILPRVVITLASAYYLIDHNLE